MKADSILLAKVIYPFAALDIVGEEQVGHYTEGEQSERERERERERASGRREGGKEGRRAGGRTQWRSREKEKELG